MGNPTIYGPHEEPNSRSLDYKGKLSIREVKELW